MIKKFIAGAVLALCLQTPSQADTLDGHDAKRAWASMIAESMTLDGMTVKMAFVACGEVNAYYYPSLKTVFMCNELLDESFGVIRFVAAHEMAHAIIMQKDLPYTGSHEDAADELAAVYLYANDLSDDVLEAAEWFYRFRQHKGPPFDDHTDPEKRAFKLLCLWDGARGSESELDVCYDRFSRAMRTWDRLLRL